MLPARANPFATDRVLALKYRLDECWWETYLASVVAPGFRGSVVGPHGSGKTTFMEGLATRLADTGVSVVWVRLSEEQPTLVAAGGGDVLRTGNPSTLLMVDGAEQLSWHEWWRVCRAARAFRGLLVSTHRPGRLPTLHACATSSVLLGELVSALGVPLAEDELVLLHRRYLGNLREALRELYDRAALGEFVASPPSPDQARWDDAAVRPSPAPDRRSAPG